MRKNALVICCVTCVFGAFGAFFRWLMDLTGFEADTGLYISGTVWSWAVLLEAAAFFIVLLIIVLGLKRRTGAALPAEYADAMGGTTAVFRPMYILLTVLLAGGALALLISAGEDAYPTFQRLLALLGVLGAVGFLLMMTAAERQSRSVRACLGATLLIVFYCFWLIVSYRENAASSVVWGYAPEILALAAALVAVYYVAGVPFGRPKPFAAVFFSQLAAFLCILTLPDDRATGQRVMIVATAGLLLFFSWLVVEHLEKPVSAE